MLNFLLYLLSFAANTIIILTAPKSDIHAYLGYYNVFGVFFSVFFFLYYRYLCSIKVSRFILGVFLAVFLLICLKLNVKMALFSSYPGILIFVDYLVTQTSGVKAVNVFRVGMIVSAIPFLVFRDDFELNLLVRCGMLFAVCVIFAFTAKEEFRLSVRSTWKFLAGNYLFYNGTLIAVTWLIQDASELRWWYLSIQIGLVLILKALDFSLRRSYDMSPSLRGAVFTMGALVPLPVMMAFPSVLNLLIFYIGYGGLVFTSRYISHS